MFVPSDFQALCVLNPDRVQSPEEDPQEMEEALETITDFADSIDTSNGTITFYIHLSHRLRNVIITDLPFTDFHKIGGFVILQPCLNSPHEGIRWRCCQLIACITQNNPYCQLQTLKEGLVPILLKMLESDSCSEARIKALYAISCKLLLNQ